MRWIGRWLFEPNLWHFNRRSVATGFAAGLFAGVIPIPLHMALAIILCIALRGHVALAILATWVINPVTFAPIYYFNYKLGAFILGQTPPANLPMGHYEALLQHIDAIWLPLLAGSLVCGIVVALVSYVTIRLYWRSQVLKSWKKRRQIRQQQAIPPQE